MYVLFQLLIHNQPSLIYINHTRHVLIEEISTTNNDEIEIKTSRFAIQLLNVYICITISENNLTSSENGIVFLIVLRILENPLENSRASSSFTVDVCFSVLTPNGKFVLRSIEITRDI